MSAQYQLRKMKRYFIERMLLLYKPAPSSVREMAEMNDLDLRDLAIGRSQVPYLFQTAEKGSDIIG